MTNFVGFFYLIEILLKNSMFFYLIENLLLKKMFINFFASYAVNEN